MKQKYTFRHMELDNMQHFQEKDSTTLSIITLNSQGKTNSAILLYNFCTLFASRLSFSKCSSSTLGFNE